MTDNQPMIVMTADYRSKRTALIDIIREGGARRRETPVMLRGGGTTDVYLDIKGILTTNRRLALAADVMLDALSMLNLRPSAVGGPTMGADVLTHAMVARDLSRGLQWFSVRDQPKTTHGLGRWIEGKELGIGDKVVITDDVASTGHSLVEAYEHVIATGATVLAIIPLVDRAERAQGFFAEVGTLYCPVIHYHELGIEAL